MIKNILLILFFFLNSIFANGQNNNKQDITYSSKFICKKRLAYDSTKPINYTVRGLDTTKMDKTIFREFDKSFITSIINTYEVSNYINNTDSATIVCYNFKSNSQFARFTHGNQNYFITNNRLFKKNSSQYVELKTENLKLGNQELIDSVIYLNEFKKIGIYDCQLAISVSDSNKLYYICKDLPKLITPGVLVKNSIGGILEISSLQFQAKLISIKENNVVGPNEVY